MDGRSGRLRMAGAGVLAATFLVGGLGGVALDRLLLSRDTVQGAPTVSVADPGPARTGERGGDRDRRGGDRNDGDWQADFWRRSDYGKLGLDSTQVQRVNVVLIRQREQMDAYWKATRPQYDSIVEQTRSDLRSVLTPAQRMELDRIRAERRERWRREREQQQSKDERPHSSPDHDREGRGCP